MAWFARSDEARHARYANPDADAAPGWIEDLISSTPVPVISSK